MIADAPSDVLSSWVDSMRVIIQPAARIIGANGMAFNRGAAADLLRRTRSADITPELTGRGDNLETIQVLDESYAIRAPVE